ncbi:MAG: hypothetical protein A2283_19135 [Lentisphaerae bacterium RIFOXYA12_FULL_48_11]|nr:MAG: hypothetical protein A2283_19135 [Lentisphaerae bacterium RIFOXYA12_FULL_48_11]
MHPNRIGPNTSNSEQRTVLVFTHNNYFSRYSYDKEHGRYEHRELWALPVSPEDLGFCGAEQVMRIHRHFKQVRAGKESDEIVFAVTSLSPLPDPKANAELLLKIIRGHWSIENGNHYVRDRSYDEDRCQVRDPNNAPIQPLFHQLRRQSAFLTQPLLRNPCLLILLVAPSCAGDWCAGSADLPCGGWNSWFATEWK